MLGYSLIINVLLRNYTLGPRSIKNSISFRGPISAFHGSLNSNLAKRRNTVRRLHNMPDDPCSSVTVLTLFRVPQSLIKAIDPAPQCRAGEIRDGVFVLGYSWHETDGNFITTLKWIPIPFLQRFR